MLQSKQHVWYFDIEFDCYAFKENSKFLTKKWFIRDAPVALSGVHSLSLTLNNILLYIYGFTAPPPLPLGSTNPNADAELNETADNITSAISTMVSDLNAGKSLGISHQFLQINQIIAHPLALSLSLSFFVKICWCSAEQVAFNLKFI